MWRISVTTPCGRVDGDLWELRRTDSNCPDICHRGCDGGSLQLLVQKLQENNEKLSGKDGSPQPALSTVPDLVSCLMSTCWTSWRMTSALNPSTEDIFIWIKARDTKPVRTTHTVLLKSLCRLQKYKLFVLPIQTPPLNIYKDKHINFSIFNLFRSTWQTTMEK